MRRLISDSLEKTLMLGNIEGRRRRGQTRDDEMMRWLDGITNWWTWVWASSRSWWWIGKPGMLQSMGLQRVGHDWATELNWFQMAQNGWRESQAERTLFWTPWHHHFPINFNADQLILMPFKTLQGKPKLQSFFSGRLSSLITNIILMHQINLLCYNNF